jgi:Domain of unknown function DUF29
MADFVMQKPTKTDWEELALTSHYNTAVAIRAALQAGETHEAMTGIEELIDALSRSDERAIKSYLVRVMQHIIKWQVQPGRRGASWAATIREGRRQVRELQEEHPRFTDERIRSWWPKLLESAVNEAEADLNWRILGPPTLTWDEVFTVEYWRPADALTPPPGARGA